MTRYISWVLEVDIEFSSSSQLITLTSNHRKRIGVHRFRLLAEPSRSSSTSTPTSLGHIVTPPIYTISTIAILPSRLTSTPQLPRQADSVWYPPCPHTTQIDTHLSRPSTLQYHTTASVYQRNHLHYPAVQSRTTIHHVRPLPIHASCMRSRGL